MSASTSGPKVVFVNRYFHPDHSATSQMLSDLAFGLADRGFSVHVVCSRQLYDRSKAVLPRSEIIRGVTVHRVWTTRFGRARLAGRAVDYASFYLSCGARLLWLASPGDTLVAQTDPPLISVMVAGIAALRRARLMNWLHDIFPEIATLLGANPLSARLDRVLRRLRDGSLRGAAINVVLGDRMRELLSTRAAAAQLHVIENWAASESECAQAGRSELRTRLGLTGKFVVGYSGNLGRAHEYETLLGAAVRCAADSQIVFLMIGAGARMQALEDAVRRLGLGSFCFTPLQPRSALADTLAAADLHWLSLRPELEGLIVPSKLYGILAAGRPVLFIGDTDGEVARVIGPSQAGVSVAVGQSEELARHIVRLKSDPALRERLGGNARRLYRDRFTKQRAVERWAELLRADGMAVRITPDGLAAGASIPPPSSR